MTTLCSTIKRSGPLTASVPFWHEKIRHPLFSPFYEMGTSHSLIFWHFIYAELRTRLDFGTGQIAIFIGELYFMLPFTLQVKHLIPFPRMEMHQNILNKMN